MNKTNQQTLMSRDYKREVSIEELCKLRMLNKDACNWLKVALDPNHDQSLKVVGLPDSDTDSSVVVKVEKSLSVTKPDGVTGLWDAHFISQPTVYSELGGGTGSIRVFAINDPPGTMQIKTEQRPNLLNPFTVCSVPSGDRTFHPNTDADYAGLNFDSFVCTQSKKPKYRVIANAMKITNSTAQLTKQGTVTTYSFDPSHKRESYVVYNDGDVFKGRIVSETIRGPPVSLASAKLFPSSKTWEAAEGAYCVNKLDLTSLRPSSVETSYFTMRANEDADYNGFMHPDRVNEFIPGTVYADYTNCGGLGKLGGTDTVGAYFTGLSEETTLTFDTTTYLEIFPETDEFMKATASASMRSCNNALLLYQLVARTMPSGVRACDNDAGSWFRKIAKTAAGAGNLLSPILMENPYGAAAVGGLNLVNEVASQTEPKRKPKTKGKKT